MSVDNRHLAMGHLILGVAKIEQTAICPPATEKRILVYAQGACAEVEQLHGVGVLPA